MPGRIYTSSDQDYKFGFNGMLEDDEVKGKGNSLDFGARIYDSRIARWLSVDPLQKKYASHSPYNFTLNNPIFFKDVDGKDVGVTITKNAEGGGKIVFSATNFVTGTGATDDLVKNWNESGHNKFSGNYIDKDGHTWEVEVNVTFTLATDKDVQRVQNASVEANSENLLIFNESTDRSHAGLHGSNYDLNANTSLYPIGCTADECGFPIKNERAPGNISNLSIGADSRTAVHETLHLYGLGDRYSDVTYEFTYINGISGRTATSSIPHVGYSDDIMAGGINFNQVHIDNLAKKALEIDPIKGGFKFTMGRLVDKANAQDASAVPQTLDDGKYTNPKSDDSNMPK